MGKEDLITLIQEKYKKGERRDAIKQGLISQGWSEGDIDAAISQIQHDAIIQMPGVSAVAHFFDTLDTKTSHASPKLIGAVLAGSAIIVALISLTLYIVLDPLGSKLSDRDKQRETDFILLRNAIERFYVANRVYPSSLNELLSTFVQSIPQDPKTGKLYQYKPVEGGNNFELCVMFETKPGQCVSSTPVDVLIPLNEEPTETPQIDIEASPSAEVVSPTPSVNAL